MDPLWLERCYNGGEYDVARCAYVLYGTITDERVLSVKLSEHLAHEFSSYAIHISAAGLDPDKAQIMGLLSRKLRTSDYKKKVMQEYKNICFVFDSLAGK